MDTKKEAEIKPLKEVVGKTNEVN